MVASTARNRHASREGDDVERKRSDLTGAMAPLLATAAGLLVLAGLSKLRAPLATRQALSTIGLRVGAGPVRALAAAELAIGLWCIVSPGPAAACCLAAAYLAFAAVMALLVRAGADVGCGCFGARSFRASRGHVALDLIAAAIGVGAAVSGPKALLALPVDGAAMPIVLLGVGCAIYLAYLLFTVAPAMWGSYQVEEAAR